MMRLAAALFVALMLLCTGVRAATPAPKRTPATHSKNAVRSAAPSPLPTAVVPSGGAAFGLGVWTVHASSVDANFKTGSFSTPNKVVMTRIGGDVTADRANGNYKKKIVYLDGHVVMHDSTGNYGGMASAPSAPPSAPSTITADKATIDGMARTYEASGNVHYVQADTVVDADDGTLDDVSHELFLKGNVHVTQGTHSLRAQSVRYNTITGMAHAQGNVTMQFPGEFKRGIATPRPIGLPKNPVIKPVRTPPP